MEPEQETQSSGLTTKYIIGIVVVIIIIAGFFFLNRKIEAPATGSETTSPETTTSTPKVTTPTNPTDVNLNPTADKPSVTVNLTDSGFSPASIKIKKGQKVEFVNMSSGLMWVASAPHPSHTNYPEFDEKGVAQRGDTYAFTFDKIGTWKYHNHLNPTQTGTVIAE